MSGPHMQAMELMCVCMCSPYPLPTINKQTNKYMNAIKMLLVVVFLIYQRAGKNRL